MSKVVILDHPLIAHKVTHIRKKTTNTKEFRETVSEIGGLMAFEISRDFPLQDVNVETPMCMHVGKELSKQVIIVPILRAGLGMVEGILNLIPTSKVGHIGIYRDEETLEPKEYFAKLPTNLDEALILVVDPMLATGGSASAAITVLKKRGAKDIRFIGLVGVDEGIKKLQSDHPDVDIYLACKDAVLNEHGYIEPGLGDCGDRLFGTK